MGFVAQLKWQMQICVRLLQIAKIRLSDVRNIRLLLLLCLGAFPEPTGLPPQDFPEACATLSVASAARGASGLCYTGRVRPGQRVPGACEGVVLWLAPGGCWPPPSTFLPSEMVPAPPSHTASLTTASDFRGRTLICDCVCGCAPSAVSDSLRPMWTVARQAPLSTGFSRQEHWSGLPCPPPRDLPDPGIEPASPAFPALADEFFTTEPPGKPESINTIVSNYCAATKSGRGTETEGLECRLDF